MPMIGTSGMAACTCQTQRTATGRIAGPDRPPVTPAERRPHRVGVDHHAEQRVDHRQAVGAGARRTASAISTMSVTSGESLAKHRDRRGRCCAAPRDHLGGRRSGRRRTPGRAISTFGHEMLTSIAVTPATMRSLAASLRVLVDACRRRSTRWCGRRARAATARSLLDERVDARALQADRVEHAARASRPCAASPGPSAAASMIDLVTIAPISVMSKNWSSSRPAAAQPDAVSTGFGSSRPASVGAHVDVGARRGSSAPGGGPCG